MKANLKWIRLDNIQTDLLLTNLDEDGKLSCLKAFKVARLIGVKPKEMDNLTKSMNIKITNCELGVLVIKFFKNWRYYLWQTIKNFTDEKSWVWNSLAHS